MKQRRCFVYDIVFYNIVLNNIIIIIYTEKSGIPENKVRELIQLTPDICSLDVPTGEDAGGTLMGLLEDTQATQPYAGLVRQELDHTMDRLLSGLTERQQKILRLHFGMEDGVCWSLEDIGRELGISKERVRQIERQAMEKLQKDGQGLGLDRLAVPGSCFRP